MLPSYLQDDDTAIALPSAAEDEDEFERQLQAAGPEERARLPWLNPAIQPPVFEGAGPGPTAGPTGGPSAPGPPSGPDFAKLEQIYGERPALPKPKWWQNLAGGAAGFGAGWSNAAGRTKNPIDINAMRENILYPGYKQKFEQWHDRLQPAEDIAKLKSQEQQAWWKNQEIQARSQYYKARADYEQGLGRGALIEVTPEMEETTSGIFKTGTRIPASTASEIARIAAGKYVKPERTLKVTDPDIAKRIGVEVGTDVPNSIYEKALKPTGTHNLNAQDVLLHPQDFEPSVVQKAQEIFNGMHRGRAATGGRGAGAAAGNRSKAIETKMHDRLLKAEKDAASALALGKSTESEVYERLAHTKQQIQDAYENEIRAAGGSAEHYQYGAGERPATTETAPIAEGTVIRSKTNPGHRMVFRQGKWQPLQ